MTDFLGISTADQIAGPPDGEVAEVTASSLREIALHMSTPKGRG